MLFVRRAPEASCPPPLVLARSSTTELPGQAERFDQLVDLQVARVVASLIRLHRFRREAAGPFSLHLSLVRKSPREGRTGRSHPALPRSRRVIMYIVHIQPGVSSGGRQVERACPFRPMRSVGCLRRHAVHGRRRETPACVRDPKVAPTDPKGGSVEPAKVVHACVSTDAGMADVDVAVACWFRSEWPEVSLAAARVQPVPSAIAAVRCRCMTIRVDMAVLSAASQGGPTARAARSMAGAVRVRRANRLCVACSCASQGSGPPPPFENTPHLAPSRDGL